MRGYECLNMDDAIFYCTQCGIEVDIWSMTPDDLSHWIFSGECLECMSNSKEWRNEDDGEE